MGLLCSTAPVPRPLLCVPGSVEAISLREIYVRATGRTPTAPALRVKDSAWEKLSNASTAFVHIYRYRRLLVHDLLLDSSS